MNATPDTVARPIGSVAELLVHALELEHEAATHYEGLADSLATHHNAAVAALFQRLAQHSRRRAGDLAARAGGLQLPRIAPWAFKWDRPGNPSDPDCLHAEVGYRMRAVEALRLAIHNASRGHAFYLQVIGNTPDPAARQLAAELAATQTEELTWLAELLAHEALTDRPLPEDLDPPQRP